MPPFKWLPGRSNGCKQKQPIYKDAKAPIEERVNDLVSRMTLEERYNNSTSTLWGGITTRTIVVRKIKIPATLGSLIYFDEDANLRNEAQRKQWKNHVWVSPSFRIRRHPRVPYHLSHLFGTSMFLESPIGRTSMCRCRPGSTHVRGRLDFSPMIDVARDGRWGRVAEGYGEDPYTNAVFGVASIKGYQGEDMSDSKRVAACLKHYIGYGASEAGRDYVYTEISNQTLWDTYIPPYEAGVKAGAATLMSSFNDISGTPGSANHYTMTEILKNRWKHDGFVVSDWSAVPQLIDQGHAADRKEAARLAFNAGLEMDMMGHCYDKHMAKLVEEGK